MFNHASAGSCNTPRQIVYSGAGIAVPVNFMASTFGAPVEYRGSNLQFQPIGSVSVGSDTLTMLNGSDWPARWDSCTFQSSGTVPAPLVAGATYYVVNPVNQTFGVSATPGGAVIDLTTSGSGSITVTGYMTDLGLPPYVARCLDSGAGAWGNTHTADGVFNWTRLDGFVDYHFAQRGRKLLYCFSYTPTWNSPYPAVNDAFGQPGGGQVPVDMTKGATFVTALLNRYNTGGNKPFMGIEAWNEPSFYAPGTASQNWCGTPAQLAQFTRLINVAAKAADPSILVLSPGFTNGTASGVPSTYVNTMYGYLTASDGAAGYGKDWIDGCCFHNYDTADNSISGHVAKIELYRRIIATAGLSANYPLYQTERGVNVTEHPLHWIRMACIDAALGLKMSVQYACDFYGHNPRTNPTLLAGMISAYDHINGKTLTYCCINQDLSVTVTANGVTKTY